LAQVVVVTRFFHRTLCGAMVAAAGHVRAGRPAVADSSDSDAEETPPCQDGGFDNCYAYIGTGVFAEKPKPKRIREIDEPKDFNCLDKHVPVATVAPRRTLATKPSGVRSTGDIFADPAKELLRSSGNYVMTRDPMRSTSGKFFTASKELPQTPRRDPIAEVPSFRTTRAVAGFRSTSTPAGGRAKGSSDGPAKSGFQNAKSGLDEMFRSPDGAGVSSIYGGTPENKAKASNPVGGSVGTLGGRSKDLACSVKNLNIMGSTSRSRFGGAF